MIKWKGTTQRRKSSEGMPLNSYNEEDDSRQARARRHDDLGPIRKGVRLAAGMVRRAVIVLLKVDRRAEK